MESESSKECSVSFLWTNESFSLWNCLSRNSTLFYTSDRSAWLVLNKPRQRDFWRHFTFRTLWSKKSTFLKGNFCIYKGFMDVFYILISAWKKNHKMCIWNWFFPMCSTDLKKSEWTQRFNLSYANCFLGLTYGFLNKNFQEIKLFICHCSFITLAQKRPWDYRSWDF